MFGSKEKNDCPFWRGPCKKEECRLYMQVIGPNPNTGEQQNNKGCAFEFIPLMLIENSMLQRQTGAAVESFRNENVGVNQAALSVLQGFLKAADNLPKSSPKIIEG